MRREGMLRRAGGSWAVVVVVDKHPTCSVVQSQRRRGGVSGRVCRIRSVGDSERRKHLARVFFGIKQRLCQKVNVLFIKRAGPQAD